MMMALTFSIAFSQVVEMQVSIGGPTVSLDELPLLACAGILLLSGKIGRVSGLLLAFGLIELGVRSIYPLVNGQIVPLISEVIKLVILLAVYGTLANNAKDDVDSSFALLARYWVILAVISAGVILLQSADLLPKQALVQGSIKTFPRPTGIQNDPNFAANSLALAVLFLKMLRLRPLYQNGLIGLMLIAIFLTESRMGLVLAVFILTYWWLISWRISSLKAVRSRVLGTLCIIAVVAVGSFTLAQSDRNFRVFERFSSIVATLEATTLLSLERTRGLQRESAQERLILAYAGYRVWRDNKLIGVGQDRIAQELRITAGIEKSTHNGYIDRMMIGGVFGILFVGFVAYLLLLSTRLRLRQSKNHTILGVKVLLPTVCIASMLLNVSFWPVLTMLAACLASQNVSLRIRRSAPAAQLV
ncbi:O-antigen ligase family protein [Cognatiyoonia koreensis]|nr:O-antigen ligase family protein [Cognatiyoonia koreensis]